MEITYTNHEGFCLPDLTLTRKEDATFGRYGHLRLKYLKEHRRVLYINLLTTAPQRSRPTGTGDAGAALSLAGTHQHRQDAAQRAASCYILFSAGKTCVRLSGGAGLSGEAQHFPGLHPYLPGLSACVSLFSTFLTTSGGSCFSSFSALRQRDSSAEMWARC